MFLKFFISFIENSIIILYDICFHQIIVYYRLLSQYFLCLKNMFQNGNEFIYENVSQVLIWKLNSKTYEKNRRKKSMFWRKYMK